MQHNFNQTDWPAAEPSAQYHPASERCSRSPCPCGVVTSADWSVRSWPWPHRLERVSQTTTSAPRPTHTHTSVVVLEPGNLHQLLTVGTAVTRAGRASATTRRSADRVAGGNYIPRVAHSTTQMSASLTDGSTVIYGTIHCRSEWPALQVVRLTASWRCSTARDRWPHVFVTVARKAQHCCALLLPPAYTQHSLSSSSSKLSGLRLTSLQLPARTLSAAKSIDFANFIDRWCHWVPHTTRHNKIYKWTNDFLPQDVDDFRINKQNSHFFSSHCDPR